MDLLPSLVLFCLCPFLATCLFELGFVLFTTTPPFLSVTSLFAPTPSRIRSSPRPLALSLSSIELFYLYTFYYLYSRASFIVLTIISAAQTLVPQLWPRQKTANPSSPRPQAPVPIPRRRTARSVPHRPGAAKTTLKRADPHLKATPTTPSPSRSPASGTLPPTPTRSRTRPRRRTSRTPTRRTSSSTSRRPTTPPHTNRAGAMPSSAPRLSARTSSSARSSRTASSAAYAPSGCSCGRTAATAHIRGCSIAGSVWHGSECLVLHSRESSGVSSAI
jgi:hypothetical protein